MSGIVSTQADVVVKGWLTPVNVVVVRRAGR